MTSEFDPMDTETVTRRLGDFLRRNTLENVRIGGLKRFTVGFSWVTFGFEASWDGPSGPVAKRLILRIGPPTGIFAPYRAAPEFITLGSLAGSGVPVPAVYWMSDDPADLGAPFIISEWVEGTAPVPWSHDGGAVFSDAERENLGSQFVGALANLHAFDWRRTPVAGIGDIPTAEGAAKTRIAQWKGLYERWSPNRIPILEWAALWLERNAPVAQRITVVHGDFRIGNFLEKDGRILAILDWELVDLGDPVEDLGWICLQAWRGRSPYMCHFFTREELRDRYAALSGVEVAMADIRWWEVFGTYKLAVMHYAATYSFETLGFNDLRMAGMGAQIPRMLLQLETAMERAA